MKKVLFFIVCGGFLAGCTGSAYHLSDYEKDAQRGFHANQANKIIETNEKNKKVNAKALEKQKQAQNDHLNALNKNKPKGGHINDRTFKFY
jgi:hypothetical protein